MVLWFTFKPVNNSHLERVNIKNVYLCFYDLPTLERPNYRLRQTHEFPSEVCAYVRVRVHGRTTSACGAWSFSPSARLPCSPTPSLTAGLEWASRPRGDRGEDNVADGQPDPKGFSRTLMSQLVLLLRLFSTYYVPGSNAYESILHVVRSIACTAATGCSPPREEPR